MNESTERTIPAAEILLTVSALSYSTPYYKISAAFVIAGAFMFLRRRLDLKNPYWLSLSLPLGLGFVLSMTYGVSIGPSILSLGCLFGLAAFYFLGQIVESSSSMSNGKIFAGTALSLAILAIVETVISGAIPRLWMASPIDLAVCVLLLGLLGQSAFESRIYKTIFGITIFSAVMCSTSRAVMIAALVAFWILMPWKKARLAIVAIALIALPFLMQRLEGDPLAWNRTRIYAATVNLIDEKPWTGWGMGSYDAVVRRAQLSDPLPMRRMRAPIYAHSDLLELIFEIGLPLGSCVIAGLLLVLIRARKRSSEQFALIVSILIISLFYFPLRMLFPLFVVGFAMGRVTTENRGPLSLGKSRAGFAAIGIFFIIIGCGYLFKQPSLVPFDASYGMIIDPRELRIDQMAFLEPERTQSHMNLAKYAARKGDFMSALYSTERAVGKAPTEIEHRMQLVRVLIWHSQNATDTSTASQLVTTANRHLRFIGVVEPLHLASLAVSGDTILFELANKELTRLYKAGEPSGNIQTLRRKL